MKKELSLIEIEATIEKLDLYINGILNSSWENAVTHIRYLINFVNKDRVMRYLFKLFVDKGKAKIDVDNWMEGLKPLTLGSYEPIKFPENISERLLLIKSLLENISLNKPGFNIDKFYLMYNHKTFEDSWGKFKYDFVYLFYIDLKSLLLDLKIDASSSRNKEVPERKIINYIFDSTVQNIQADTISDTEITQNE